MKHLLFGLIVIVAAEAVSDQNQWIAFKTKYQKVYTTKIEESKRFEIFKDNLQKIKEHNKKADEDLYTYRLGITKFADLTPAEFESLMNLSKERKPILKKRIKNIEFEGDLPTKFDWREKGAVTEVKDQGSCGSCWAFSTTGAIEGAYFLNTSKLESFSEQNLVDCDSDCYGCGGGLMIYGFKYVCENGIAKESDYPYEGTDNVCKKIPQSKKIKISSYGTVPSGSESKLHSAMVSCGPISVAIDATSNLQLYKSGIFCDTLCGNKETDLDHGVLLVGCGASKEGVEYWIVKNSWGQDWGMDGYFLMAKNKNNMCGIATEASYPIM